MTEGDTCREALAAIQRGVAIAPHISAAGIARNVLHALNGVDMAVVRLLEPDEVDHVEGPTWSTAEGHDIDCERWSRVYLDGKEVDALALGSALIAAHKRTRGETSE